MAITTSHSVISQSATDQQVLPARARIGASFHSQGATAYLRRGAAASTSAYTVALVDGAHYELPWSYDGAVHVIWAGSGSGKLMVTEERQS